MITCPWILFYHSTVKILWYYLFLSNNKRGPHFYNSNRDHFPVSLFTHWYLIIITRSLTNINNGIVGSSQHLTAICIRIAILMYQMMYNLSKTAFFVFSLIVLIATHWCRRRPLICTRVSLKWTILSITYNNIFYRK